MTLEEAQQKIEQLEAEIKANHTELNDLETENMRQEREIDELGEQIEELEDKANGRSAYEETLDTIANPSNWTDGKWTPVYKFLEHPMDLANEVLNANK